jgi:hypothetical protein
MRGVPIIATTAMVWRIDRGRPRALGPGAHAVAGRHDATPRAARASKERVLPQAASQPKPGYSPVFDADWRYARRRSSTSSFQVSKAATLDPLLTSAEKTTCVVPWTCSIG